MVSRYDARGFLKNRDVLYENLLAKRNTTAILQYTTPYMKHPSAKEIENLNIVNHAWGEGDRFWKLAGKYFGRPELWWIIAWFNRMPTEGHLERGDIVAIPLPLSKILDYLDL
jgi:hypothetical protein